MNLIPLMRFTSLKCLVFRMSALVALAGTFPVTAFAGTESAPVAATKAAPVSKTKTTPVTAKKSVPVTATKAAPVSKTKATPVTAMKSVPVTVTKAAPVGKAKAAPAPATKAAYSAAGKAAPLRDAKAPPVRRALPASMVAMASPSTYLIAEGESRVYRLGQPIKRVAVGDPEVADYILLNPSELYLLGKKPGATNLIIWDQYGGFTSAPLHVSRNTKPLKVLLKLALPNEYDIEVFSLGPVLVLAGTVSDAMAAETAYRIVKAYYGGKGPENNPEYTLTNSPPASTAPKSVTGLAKNTSASGSGSDVAEPEGMRGIVNLLRVRDPQQVRLEVRIAEVTRSCVQALGLSWTQGAGSITGNIMSGFVSNATLNVLFSNGNQLGLEAECKKGLVKILAEPTLVTMSGQEGSFLVGGKVYTPTVAANGAVDYVERTYGVGLRFMPTVLDSGRISLKVAPEVSEPLKEALTAGTDTGLPSFKLSYASTTVQMNEGENLVIGGLLRDNLEETIRGVPLLSKIPIIGALFRRTDKDSEKTELMVVVRPTLVKASKSVPELPTDRFVPPTEKELFLDGKLQGKRVK